MDLREDIKGQFKCKCGYIAATNHDFKLHVNASHALSKNSTITGRDNMLQWADCQELRDMYDPVKVQEKRDAQQAHASSVFQKLVDKQIQKTIADNIGKP